MTTTDKLAASGTAPVDVLAVWDEAKRFAHDQSTSYETPYHLFTAMDEARAAVAELMEAASDVPIEYDYHGNPATPEWARFDAALSRCGVAK